MHRRGLSELYSTVAQMEEEQGGSFEDLDLRADGKGHCVRLSTQKLIGSDGESLGRVVLVKEISHEPMRREFEEIVHDVGQERDDLRARLEPALGELRSLAQRVRESGVSSRSMAELEQRVSRSQTAIQNWLDVDESMAHEDYPDAQLLIDRMRVASQRWPGSDGLPDRVAKLASSVEAYYESGENPRQRVL